MLDFTAGLLAVVMVGAALLGLGIAYFAHLIQRPGALARGMAIAYGAMLPAAGLTSLVSFFLAGRGERFASSAVALAILNLAFALPAAALLMVGFRTGLGLGWGLAAFAGVVTLLCLPGFFIAGGVANSMLVFVR
jgi:hypothetical protein